MSPSNRALYIPSIGWVISMNLGDVLVTLSFLHRLVMLPTPMELLSMPFVSLSCPSFHVESMLPMSLHLPHSLAQRKFYPESATPRLSCLHMSAIPDTVNGACTYCSSNFFQIMQRC